MPNDIIKGGVITPKDTLLDKFDTLTGEFFSAYKTQLEMNRRYYWLDFKSDVVPPTEDPADDPWPVIPDTASRAIDESANHILYMPRIKYPVRESPSGRTTSAQESAEAKRLFSKFWWQKATSAYNVLGDGRKILLNEGKIAIRQTLRWELLPELPGKDASRNDRRKYRRQLEKLGHSEFLWKQELLDNATVYEDPANHRDPQYVFVQYEILTEEAKRNYPKAEGVWKKKNDYEKVDFIEYWSKPSFGFDGAIVDKGKHYQWIDRDRVITEENPYPYVPIAIEDSGFGVNYLGAEPHEKFVGMTQKSFSIFVAQARQMTSMEAVAEITAFNPVFTHNIPPERQIRVGPRKVIPLEGAKDDPNAESVEIATWPAIPITVLQVLQQTTEMANRSFKTEVLGGIAQTGVETATEATQNVQNASASLQAPVAALSRLAEKLTRWTLMDIEHVLITPVTVFGTGDDGDPAEVTLGPKDISGFYQAQVELRTIDQEALDQIKARFWGEMYRLIPFMSAYTAMERGEITDQPMKEMIQRAAEDVFLSDEMSFVRKMTGAQSFGDLNNMIAAMVQGGGSEGPPGANSAEGLVTQDELANPLESQVRDEAINVRDINQRTSQIRA